MHPLIKPFVELCLLRALPQDLPTSGLLLGLTLVTHALSSALLSAFQLGLARGLVAGVAETALLGAMTAGLLALHRLRHRLVQTLTALAGTGTVIGVAALPVYLWTQGLHGGSGGAGAALLVLLAMVAWSVVITGHILRHAISGSFFLGLVLAVVFYWTTVNLLDGLFAAAT